MKKKKSKNNKLKIIPLHVLILLFASLAIYIFAFSHYDIVDVDNAVSYDVVISNVKYDSDNSKAWATFDASEIPAYFEFESRRASKTGDFEKLEKLADEKIQVKITLTDYNDWLRLLEFEGREHVVDIRTDDEVIFDVSSYNSYAKIRIVLWSVIATFLLVIGVIGLVMRIKLGI